ncbi:DNA/RNA non-specific endonuclease [Butyrivibrio proteoclasticus]|nr:DNA/RNA non-specific endonuclease [Butyrivibrio proteoclasticus]
MNKKTNLKNRIVVFSCIIVLGLFLGLSFRISTCAQDAIPQYSGKASVTVNKNKPQFSKKEITSSSYEKYGDLDKLGRCTPAIACIGQDLMPTEDRESIGMIKPTGWNQNKYPGLVDSEPPYLFNRCHMIGFQLTGENANEKNLITGTRYMNVEGMLPYENEVADYIHSTGNHVMYRVSPMFEGSNLLCSGVQIEALSVEDNGKGISFNVYCYNVQPGVVIDYATGDNEIDKSYNTGDFAITGGNNGNTMDRSMPGANNTGVIPAGTTYVVNKNTKKFHLPSCGSVTDMKEKNKLYYEGPREELIDQGYDPCKRCNP